MARTYNQDCILAHALDILGERWTMLILRELFLGPRRFGDLQSGLAGMGANLLSKRLKELEAAGIIAAPQDARGGYRLTETGEGLRPVIHQLVGWSIHYFKMRSEPSPARDCIYSDDLQPDSVALALEIFSNLFPAPDLTYVAHLTIDEFQYTLYHMNGKMTVRRGADGPATITVKGDVATMMQAYRGEISRDEALARLTVSGEQKAIDHLIDCIVYHEEAEATVTPIAANQ